ncbi:MAG TPA: YHS domain-containing protein [Burkholderiales bacterium]|nr:YHS domain-containing protein [Burkholderiales bacterium]
MSKDPVCGAAVEVSPAAVRSEFEGATYYFCCAECRQRFASDPVRFIAEGPQRARIPCCGFGMVRRTVQRGAA